MKAARNFLIIALIALAAFVVPGGGNALATLLTVVTIAFFVAIALLGYRMYREHKFTLDALPQLDRGVLYASVGLAFLTFAASDRLFNLGAGGALAWIALLALCSYGVFWVFMRARRFD